MVRTTRPEKTRNWWRLAFILVTAFLLVWLVFLAYRMFVANRPATQTSTPTTNTTSIAETSPTTANPIAIAAEGEIVPLRSAKLSLTASGLVAHILVSDGESVEAGQPLVQLAADDLASSLTQAEAGVSQAQARVQAAQAQLAMAQARVEVATAQVSAARAGIQVAEAQVTSAEANVRANAAEAPVIIAQSEAAYSEAQARLVQAQATLTQAQASELEAKAAIDQATAAISEAEAGVAQAEAVFKTARATLAKTTLTAPFAGKVAQLEVEQGETVNPAMPVVQLADFTAWHVETTDLTELDVVNLDIGQNVKVEVDALPGQVLEGTITKIAEMSVLKRGDVTYEVMVALENSEGLPLRWGMTAFVDFTAP
jgi:multidrug resistance efflux pump